MEIFEQIRKLGRKPVTARVGGFRPEEGIRSWIGGNFAIDEVVGWPRDASGFMVPVIQILVSEIPGGREYFGNAGLVQVFLSKDFLPVGPVRNGLGWRLMEFSNLEQMSVVQTPAECAVLKPFQIRWSLADADDYPCWEEAWDYLDLSEINESEELTERFFEEFESADSTKIGGYASYIQSPKADGYQYIFQIASEEKANLFIGDGGNIYILKDEDDGEWYLDWDC